MTSWTAARLTRRFAGGVCLLLAGLAMGCAQDGPELAEVSGRVMLDGQPLPEAEVLFEPEHGRPSRGTTDEEGEYRLQYTPQRQGALIGKHTVRISTYRAEDDSGQQEVPERVPEDYNTASALTKLVEPSGNRFDFDLHSK